MLNEISIEIIRKCTNNCIHCSSMSNEKCTEILDFSKFKEIVIDAKKLGAGTICFSGGEPFLHKDIVEMIRFVASLKMQSYVYTSGVVFDDNNKRTSISGAVLSSIAPYVTKIIYNIEAATSSTYDRIMGTRGCFPHLLGSIEESISCSIVTEAHFVPMKANIYEIDEVVKLCENMHISKLSFLRLVMHGRAKFNREQIELTDEEYRTIKSHLRSIKKESKIDIRIGLPLDSKCTCVKCEAACGKLNINYNGVVFPCEVFKNDETAIIDNVIYPISIYDKTLLDIYENSPYLKLVREKSKAFENIDMSETCLGQYLINAKRKSDPNE